MTLDLIKPSEAAALEQAHTFPLRLLELIESAQRHPRVVHYFVQDAIQDNLLSALSHIASYEASGMVAPGTTLTSIVILFP